jgi:hypothetical protein
MNGSSVVGTAPCLILKAYAHMQTYDSSMASEFQVPTSDSVDVPVNYVRVLNDILKLDYGPLHASVILLRCKWFKQQDNRRNSTYKRDNAGFL